MTMSATAAFAAAEAGEFGNGTFSATPEDTITATGVTKDDSVEYYQLVEWKNGNWALTGLGTNAGVALADLIDGIDETEATTIAKNLASATKTGNMDVDATDSSGTTFKKTGVAAGLYYLKAVPAANNIETVYNPAFVSADYYNGNNTVNFSSNIGSSSVVKKSSVPFDKKVDTTRSDGDTMVDVKAGDIIPYEISTTIPSYGTSFDHPVFTITDTLSAGLQLDGDVTVNYGGSSTTETINNVVTITKGTSSNGFTVAFAESYLKNLNGATPAVKITYSAKVTTEALDNITYMDNKAKLTFSNSPTTQKDQEDITRHYTFSLDANLNGGNHGNSRTRELIKIGVDPTTGVSITDFTSWVDGQGWTTYTPLSGATFSLTDGTNTYTAESDANGYISFKGLDAGSYTLTETAAPEGYIKDSTAYAVVITPTYKTGTDEITGYTVKIGDSTTSTYTITNMSDENATVETTVDSTSKTFPFVNTHGTELPSTGGIGTTIFYVVGALLVLGAGVLLVTRRRARASEQ